MINNEKISDRELILTPSKNKYKFLVFIFCLVFSFYYLLQIIYNFQIYSTFHLQNFLTDKNISYFLIGIFFTFLSLRTIIKSDFIFKVHDNTFYIFDNFNTVIDEFKLAENPANITPLSGVYLKFENYNFFRTLKLFLTYPFYILFAWNGVRLSSLMLTLEN